MQRGRAVLKSMKKTLTQWVTRALEKNSCGATIAQPVKSQIWSIGIFAGNSPLELGPSQPINNPVLTRDSVSDVHAIFVADPFMLQAQGTWHMFFEVMNAGAGRGEIGLATSQNTVDWHYQQIVLREPFHLSYPYTFKWNDAYYMVPESYQANSVRLYKAEEFPSHWTFVKTLLEGDEFVDPTIFHLKDRWWLFTDFARPPFYAGVLRLFYADRLEGPWAEHPKSPVVEGNPRIARPAGRVVVVNEKLVRFGQECYPTYGTQVRAFEITELSDTQYEEHEFRATPILEGSGLGWNQSGMHHIDAHPTGDGRWLACVDGFQWQTQDEAPTKN